jgi:hypothetical protein
MESTVRIGGKLLDQDEAVAVLSPNQDTWLSCVPPPT